MIISPNTSPQDFLLIMDFDCPYGPLSPEQWKNIDGIQITVEKNRNVTVHIRIIPSDSHSLKKWDLLRFEKTVDGWIRKEFNYE